MRGQLRDLPFDNPFVDLLPKQGAPTVQSQAVTKYQHGGVR
jgi:hypothetical protein